MDIAALLLKTTVLFACALAVAFVSRRSPRRVHQMWTVVFAAVIAMPVLVRTLPGFGLPLANQWMDTPISRPPLPAPRPESGITADQSPPSEVAQLPTSAAAPADNESSSSATAWPFGWAITRVIVLGVWLTGALVATGMIVVSLLRVHRLVRSAVELRDPAWRALVADICLQLGVEPDVRLVLSREIDTPMAGQLWRRTVFLPATATAWTDDCRRAVLGHELAHLAAHDPRRHLGARLMLALYWFHPLAWVAAAIDTHASEEACDDAVVRRLGLRPSSYARVLLELAESAGRARLPLVALPGARRSRLERRVTAILSDVPRPGSGIPVPAIGCGILAVLLASAQPRAQATPQSVTDPVDSIVRSSEPDVAAIAVDGPSAAGARDNPAASPPAVQLPDVACGAIAMKGEPPGGLVATERVETHGFTRRLLRSFGELHLCLVAEGVASPVFDKPGAMLAAATRGVLEARHAGTSQRLEIAASQTDLASTTFSINGIRRSSDATVNEWRRLMLAVLETTWEIATLRGSGRRAAELEGRRQGEVVELLRIVQTMGGTESAHGGPRPGPSYDPPSACELTPATGITRAVAGAGATAGRAQPRHLRETFGDLEVCVRIDEGNVFETTRPSELMRRARFAVLEARRGDTVHQLVITGANREEWLVNGVPRPIDDAVRRWKDRIVDVLDTSWNIFALQGREGLLNGRIGEIAGRVSLSELRQEDAERTVRSIRAEIEALRVDDRIAVWTSERQDQVGRFRAAMTAIQ